MAKGYSAQDIKILEGLDAVRMRPGMYIGSTGTKGLHHILWEIVDNAIDEAANGHADKIDVTLYEDGSAAVMDSVAAFPPIFTQRRVFRALKSSLHSCSQVVNLTKITTTIRAGYTASVHRLPTRFPNG